MQEVYKASDTCKKSAKKVCEEFRTLHVDTEHVSTLGVSTDCVEVPSELCPSENHKEDRNSQKSDDDSYFNIGWNVYAEPVHIPCSRNVNPRILKCYECLVLNIELRGIDYRGHAFCKEHSRKCYNERLNIEICYEITLHKAECDTDCKGEKDCSHHIPSLVIEVDRGTHAYQSCEFADRDIYSTRDHDYAHCARKYYESSILSFKESLPPAVSNFCSRSDTCRFFFSSPLTS